MRYIFIMLAVGMAVLGCARDVAVTVAPDALAPETAVAQSNPADQGPYRLWGEYTFFISADHDRVDVVPSRNSHFHLNALKFLEDYCKDCLQIQSIRNNGDGTIDLAVRITHPFLGFPQYTGFDVKGIIMFNGSYEYDIPDLDDAIPVDGPFFRVSWKEYGDPEVLNPDGFTFRWNPEWDSGSKQPIFNYWKGRYASGVPTAHINAYLNFYSSEERHMFAHDASVVRTYHIWLPPGPVVAGYAVEACWEPPTVMPVTNPVTDFPITANQPEPYIFTVLINDGNAITDCDSCCHHSECEDVRFQFRQWYGPSCNQIGFYFPDAWIHHNIHGDGIEPCPDYDSWYLSWQSIGNSCEFGNGPQKSMGHIFHFAGGQTTAVAWTLFDFVIDDPDLD